MKPVKLIVHMINNSSHLNDGVLDMFGGSGSTLLACEETGRRCFILELEPKYCDVIISRYEAFTGKKAVKI
jgi:DNA modification methylase